MKKIKNSQLFVASLVLAIALCSPIAIAKAVDANQADVNANQAQINANQANVNANQANVNANQANVNENQSNANKGQGNNNKLNGDSHRSAVATFVQGLLNVANREQGGIGDQVRVIANAQNDSKDNVANEIDKVQNRNGFKTFLIGTDYKTIGQLRSEMVTTGNQIGQLTALLAQTTDATDKAALQTQIQALTQDLQKIGDFIKANDSRFSIFGWFVKLFSK